MGRGKGEEQARDKRLKGRDGIRGRWEGGSAWGTHVHPWLIHVNV